MFFVHRHATVPRFTGWPGNHTVEEGGSLVLECVVHNCNTVLLSRDFLPRSVDGGVIQLKYV